MSKILIISDLHVGSKFAIAPNSFNNYTGNSTQRAIHKHWNEMINSKYDYLIMNGDIVNGVERQSEGVENWTNDLDEQVDAACELTKEISFKKLLVTYGTPYHTKENMNCDQVFAKRMGAVSHDHDLNFQPEGQKDIFHISHAVGISTASWQYRTTPLAKELVAALLNEKELYKYRGIIRSHAHYYCAVEFNHQFGLITPCWQTRTPYMIRKGLALIPKLGYVTLEQTEDDWHITPHCFNMPRPTLVTV